MPKNYKEPIYTLDLNAEECSVHGFVNGFPAYRYNAKFAGNFAMPINAYLIGGGNRLEIRADPSEPIEENEFDPEAAKVEGAVKVYENGGISAPELGERITEITRDDFDLSNVPVRLEIGFDTRGPAFRGLFTAGQIITDEDELKKYARYLVGLLNSGDTNALLEEFKPKLHDFAIAYYDDPDDYYKQFLDFMNSEFIPAGVLTDIPEEMLSLRSWCGGRIWELFFLPNHELFRTKPDDNDEQYTISVFVAKIEQKLRVIR